MTSYRVKNDNRIQVEESEENGNVRSNCGISISKTEGAMETLETDNRSNDDLINDLDDQNNSKGKTFSLKIRPNLQVIFERRSNDTNHRKPTETELPYSKAEPISIVSPSKSTDNLTDDSSEQMSSIQGAQSVPVLVDTVPETPKLVLAADEAKSIPPYARSLSRKSLLVRGHSR